MSKETPSVLAFERKLDPSDALFHSGDWAARNDDRGWTPVRLQEKSVRGTISNRLKAAEQDPLKLDAAIDKPNLQTVDVAALPMDADTLRVRFTLRVLPGVGQPSACNKADYQKKLITLAQDYAARHGFRELARRYAINLANGRFLWRNRVGAEDVEVEVARFQQGQAALVGRFDALSFSLRDFNVPSDVQDQVQALADLIAQGLRGETHVLLQITAYVRIGNGQEVFPSQELILDKEGGRAAKGKMVAKEKEEENEQARVHKKSKTLYFVGSKKDGIAAMHSQKIGNALRTVDDWYQEAEGNGPIAVEPYGSVTTQGKAYRQPKGSKDDFYTLFDGWMLKDKVPTEAQQHYVMAVLIRGGVFGEA
ncbi:type I-F CRISPR-associated protein Csy3 [Lysobacteraceae bacterium NML07-0707]|nr:type I-F CRISPR-associated protein Csy3 [Xanthomonadaceae bacterium NML07-0707]